ncbi:hydantoinase/oxoprolinase N-terminal domain-containing protein [Lysinibacter cavernae]|uniref:Hydantoinase/oxoprolinase N-terminal domain-containing protein n=1 Tax=Lysinibacter cavernae TaxID=1640652 RepID=A0A7X5TUH4_9MICO|nr:hydantoinase/oxoprolinase N-terminal domain-containing protein [Lysinibacter cavernae]NIH54383.1 hypothetical protein [Lysinibacter cavernae]
MHSGGTLRAGIRLSPSAFHYAITDGDACVAAGTRAGFTTLSDTVAAAFAEISSAAPRVVREATVDVSGVLETLTPAPVVAIRVSPRPPDAMHAHQLPAQAADAVILSVHVKGGHDLRGQELTSLDLDGFREHIPAILSTGARAIAITGVGAMTTRDHETRIADELLEANSELHVTISHEFLSSSFVNRDYTAVMNAGLASAGAKLASMLELSCSRYLPKAELSHLKNDGGKAPVRRLAVTPIHALYSRWAAELCGVAFLASAPDGELVVSSDEGTSVSWMHSGLPLARSVVDEGSHLTIASNTAIRHPFTLNHRVPPLIADLRGDTSQPLPFRLQSTFTLPDGLEAVSVGCAIAPYTVWVDRFATAPDVDTLNRVLRAAEEDARSIVVHLGAEPTTASIIEANSFAVPFGNPDVVRLRVRAAGEVS